MYFRIDINSDIGESFGAYTIGNDEEVIDHVSSVNIACGFHAGDPQVMMKTVELAKKNGVAVGAHPGFNDLQGFGRRNMIASPAEIKADVLYQLGAISAFCKASRVMLNHVKPHGALYNMAATDREIALAIAEAVSDFDRNLIIVGLAGSEMISAAKTFRLGACSEVFADRAYEDDGTLVSRRKEGAMIHDENIAIERMIRVVKEGVIQSINGKDIHIEADSICIHGDGEKALIFAKKLREALHENGIEIIPFKIH